MNKAWVLRSIAIVMIVLGIALFFLQDMIIPGSDRTTVPPQSELLTDNDDDSEFERCARGDNPVLESYPRQCRWPNGTRVWER